MVSIPQLPIFLKLLENFIILKLSLRQPYHKSSVSIQKKWPSKSSLAQRYHSRLYLETMLEDHSNVIENLSNGFREVHPHLVDAMMGDEDATHKMVKEFLDKNLSSRLALRLGLRKI